MAQHFLVEMYLKIRVNYEMCIMINKMNQLDIDKVVKIATRAAMRGMPVRRIIFLPAQTTSKKDDFVVQYCEPLKSASELPWWDQ